MKLITSSLPTTMRFAPLRLITSKMADAHRRKQGEQVQETETKVETSAEAAEAEKEEVEAVEAEKLRDNLMR